MNRVWEYIYRISGGILVISSIVLVLSPQGSEFRGDAKAICAVFGLIFIVSMRLAKRIDHVESIQVTDRQLLDHGADDDKIH